MKERVHRCSLHSVPHTLIWIKEFDENTSTLPSSTSKSSRHICNAVRETYLSAATLHYLLVQDLKARKQHLPCHHHQTSPPQTQAALTLTLTLTIMTLATTRATKIIPRSMGVLHPANKPHHLPSELPLAKGLALAR